MTEAETADIEAFDAKIIATAMQVGIRTGWPVELEAVAYEAGVPLTEVQERFRCATSILLRFGERMDRAVLADPVSGPPRDRLFDLLMLRFDQLQAERAGMLAVLRALPFMPVTAAALGVATQCAMAKILQAAGISTSGLRGILRIKGLTGVWLWALRAWEKDGSADLMATMAALDTALQRAAQLAASIGDIVEDVPVQSGT